MQDKYILEFDQITSGSFPTVIRVKARETQTMYFVENSNGESQFPKLKTPDDDGCVSESKKSKIASLRSNGPKLYVVGSKKADEIRKYIAQFELANEVEKQFNAMIRADKFDPRIKEIAKILNIEI